MLDFDKVKFVLFDFDDTLCIHTDHGTSDGFEYIETLELGINCFADCVINESLKRFMLRCKDKGLRMGLISACEFYPRMVDKADWVLAQYGVKLENFCVSKSEYKVKVLCAIASAYGLKPYEILIVDDYFATLDFCSDLGYQACTPLEIINFVDTE